MIGVSRFLGICLLLTGAWAWAQTGAANIQGTVRDATGAVLPGGIEGSDSNAFAGFEWIVPVEADGDEDGVADSIDNCPQVPNPSQRNTDAVALFLSPYDPDPHGGHDDGDGHAAPRRTPALPHAGGRAGGRRPQQLVLPALGRFSALAQASLRFRLVQGPRSRLRQAFRAHYWSK